jgi:hypothetical protein
MPPTCRLHRSYLIKIKVPGIGDRPLVALSMEVCEIQAMDLRGIKLKRLKGDVWQYKRVRFLIFGGAAGATLSSGFPLITASPYPLSPLNPPST